MCSPAASRPSVSAPAHAPWLFFFGTLGWTWTFWIWAALASPGADADGDAPSGGRLVLYALGGFGPAIMASVFVAAGRAEETLSAFWRRALDPRLLRPRVWLAVIVLAVLPPLVVWLGSRVVSAGGVAPGTAGFLLIGAIAGLAEEPGWRGYAQEGLQRRMPVLAASLVVGVFWTAWHLPLFWMSGTWQHAQGIGTLSFWMFQAGVVVLGPIYAWLYNFAGRVTLAAIVLHAIGNLASEVFAVEGVEHIEIAVYAVVAASLVTVGKGRMRRPAQS